MRYKPCTPCKDHHGKVFPCFKDMCEYWGRIPQTVRDRETRGWSRQKALTTQGCDPKREELWHRYKDRIPYGLSMSTIWYRLGKGWPEELAFTAQPYSKLKELLKQEKEKENKENDESEEIHLKTDAEIEAEIEEEVEKVRHDIRKLSVKE